MPVMQTYVMHFPLRLSLLLCFIIQTFVHGTDFIPFIDFTIHPTWPEISKRNYSFKNGKTLNCQLKPPSDPSDKKIDIKASENAEKVAYKSDELKSITIHAGDTTSYEFVRESTKKLTGGLEFQ